MSIFTIKHSAKDVTYTVQGFRAKNKDEINKQFFTTMASSKNKIVQEIFLEEIKDPNKKSNDKSLS